MNDFGIKQLISKLTGVEITTKVAMPLLSGQATLKNRQLTWHRFNVSSIPNHLPIRMKSEISSLINRYVAPYKSFVPPEMQQNFSSMMFAWYAEDASLTEDDFKKLEASSHPHKDKMLEVARFIQDKGVPLAKSPIEFEQSKNERDKQGGFNGGQVHMENYGWAWGATEAPAEDNGDRRFHKFLSPNQQKDSSFINTVYAKGGIIVQVTTAQVDGGWGIFFTDGQEVLPVIPESAVKKMQESGNITPESPMNKDIMRTFGNISRWFAHRSASNPKAIASFRPNERRFLLDSPTDAYPKAIYWFNANEGGKKVVGPAFDGRHRGMYEERNKWGKRISIDPRIHTLMIRANGTLYWQNEADKNIKFGATQEQVDFFNHTKGSWLVLSEPGYKKFSFGDDEAAYKKYLNDCYYLNELRDFIVKNHIDSSALQPVPSKHVASQSYQCILVGPRFTAGKQVGPYQTTGTLYHPEQESPDLPISEHHSEFTGKRDDWVLEKHEFYISTFREAMQKGKFDAPTSEIGPALSDGRGATCEDAIQKAISKYNIPTSVLPQENEIAAAQGAFDAAQQSFGNKAKELQNEMVVQPLVENTPATQPEPQQQEEPLANQNDINTKNPDVFGKSSKDILVRIKKLG